MILIRTFLLIFYELKLFKIFRNITQIYIMKIYLFHILLNIIKELLKLGLTLLYVSIVNIFMNHLTKLILEDKYEN